MLTTILHIAEITWAVATVPAMIWLGMQPGAEYQGPKTKEDQA